MGYGLRDDGETPERADRLKALQVLVPNPRSPGFREEARRQARMLRGAEEEAEALDFIEARMDV